MHEHRKVPQIGQSRPVIGRQASKPIPSPLMIGNPQPPPPILGQAQQPTPYQVNEEPIHDLAMEIYSRLAISHIERNQQPDPQTLRTLARQSQMAALAYFQANSEDTNNG